MNERIQNLIEQCIDQRWTVTGPLFDREKFAELIVKECSGIAYEYDIPNLTGPGEFIGNRIKKHFGVEQ